MVSLALTLLPLFLFILCGVAQQCADACVSAVKSYDVGSAFSRPWGCSYLMTTKITPPVIMETHVHTSTDVFRTFYTTAAEHWHLSEKAKVSQRDGEPAATPTAPPAREPAKSRAEPDAPSQVAPPIAGRAESVCRVPGIPPVMSLPGYASKCGSNDAYSSACSCLGFHPTTTIVPACTQTIHSWNVVSMETTWTATRTIDISPPPCQTPYFFHLRAYLSDKLAGTLTVDNNGAPQILPNDGPGGHQPAIFYNGFNGHLQYGSAYAVVNSFDRTAKVKFQAKDPVLASSSIFALTCHIAPDCSGVLLCSAGKAYRNVMTLCNPPVHGFYIGEDTHGCAPVRLQIVNVPGSNLDHNIPLPGSGSK